MRRRKDDLGFRIMDRGSKSAGAPFPRDRGSCAIRNLKYRNQHPRRGVAAIVFVTALLVAGTLVLWVFQATATASYGALGYLYANGAFYAAESGVEFGLRELKINSDIDADGVIGSISDDGNGANDPGVGAGTFHVQYTTNKLTSTGAWQGRSRVLEVTLQ